MTPTKRRILLAATAAAAGSVAARQSLSGENPRKRLDGELLHNVSVLDFGAMGNDRTDDLAAIQRAENECSQLGTDVALYFPKGVFGITASIKKQSNVHWRGLGRIARLARTDARGAAFPLVLAHRVSSWSIEALQFENVMRSLEVDHNLTWSSAFGAANACIDVMDCTDFHVAQCDMTQFSQGIIYRGCRNFQLINNRLRSRSGKSIASLLEGTYMAFPKSVGTGGILVQWLEDRPSPPSADFVIANNDIQVPGLDIAIEALSQTFDAQPGIIAGNIIRGCSAGIQVYRGSFKDSGDAKSYSARLIIASNHISAAWEQGIYLRAVTGVTVHNNFITRAGLVGSNGVGSSAGAIVTRVNPFNKGYGDRFQSLVEGRLTDEEAILISENIIVDHGRDGVRGDPAVQIRLPNVRLVGNIILRGVDKFRSLDMPAIIVDNGEGLSRYLVADNLIAGAFSIGIKIAALDTIAPFPKARRVERNEIRQCRHGIFCDARQPRVSVASNYIEECEVGAEIIHSPMILARDNFFSACGIGLKLSVSAGARLDGNEYWNCGQPTEISEAHVFTSGEIIDGKPDLVE